MALRKEITLDNGAVIKYHRVSSVAIITNNCNIIEVSSYRDSAARAAEKSGECNVNVEASYINSEYDQGMTVISAYEHIKTLSEFSDSEDV